MLSQASCICHLILRDYNCHNFFNLFSGTPARHDDFSFPHCWRGAQNMIHLLFGRCDRHLPSEAGVSWAFSEVTAFRWNDVGRVHYEDDIRGMNFLHEILRRDL